MENQVRSAIMSTHRCAVFGQMENRLHAGGKSDNGVVEIMVEVVRGCRCRCR
jgi:hypothetical protein